MFRLERATRSHHEAGSLNDRVNLFGFIDDHTFLTKSGDVGVVVAVEGMDYECLTTDEIDGFAKRLESALKVFDDRCRVYQYLFKRNHEAIPHQLYSNPVVNAAIESRIRYLKSKADSLYSLTIYYVVLLESRNRKSSLLANIGKHPAAAARELLASFSTERQVVLLRDEIDRMRSSLSHKVSSFLLQVGDFLPAMILPKDRAFAVLKRILNLAPLKLDNVATEARHLP